MMNARFATSSLPRSFLPRSALLAAALPLAVCPDPGDLPASHHRPLSFAPLHAYISPAHCEIRDWVWLPSLSLSLSLPNKNRRKAHTDIGLPSLRGCSLYSSAAMAAARLLPLVRRRVAAVLAQSPAPPSRGFSFPSPATAGMRSLQTIIEVSNNASDEHSKDLDDSKTDTPPASVPTVESSFKVRGTSNLKISPRHDLAMIFTCKVCGTRSMKMASRESYEKGVVVARCGGCNNLHLIADRLGWFGEPGSIEDFLAEQGEEVKKGSTETLNFTLEDLVGSQVNSKDPSGQN